jgi:tetratricopeptide (TPR) repeat protein
MARYLIPVLIGCSLALIVTGVIAVTILDSPEIDYRLARGRALLDAENYLAVLQTFGDLPVGESTGPDAHSYRGAAYFRLHLYQAAIKEFESAVSQSPSLADPWIGLASIYMELGDTERARLEAGRATEVEKESAEAWITLGRAYWMEKNFDEAEKAGLRAQELDPLNPATTDLLLSIYFDQNGAEKFQSLLDRTPRLPRPLQDLAVQFYVRQGQFGRSYDVKTRYERDGLERLIFDTELTLAREPERQDLYPPLVRALVQTGRFARAIDTGRKYRGSIPIDLELGKAYWMNGEKDPAVQAYTRASAGIHKLSAETALAIITGDIRHWREAFRAERIEQDYFVLARLEDALPKADELISSFMYRYAGLYDLTFYQKAAEAAQKAVEKEPLNLDALLTLGTVYHRLNRIEDSRRTLELARREYPQNAESWSRLATLSVQDGDPQNVIEMMDQAVKLQPGNAGYLYNLGWLHDQMGNTSQAAALYERAIRLSPLSFEAMNNLALLYGSSGEPGRALRLLEQAVKSDPSNEATHFNLANYLARQRDWMNAIRSLDESLKINPSNAPAAVEKGRIFLELGRGEDAVQALNRALDADPHSYDAYLLLSSAYERTGHDDVAIAALQEAERIRAGAPEVKASLDRLNARKESQK